MEYVKIYFGGRGVALTRNQFKDILYAALHTFDRQGLDSSFEFTAHILDVLKRTETE